MAPKSNALGIRTHSGWAAYVLLSGPIDEPEILARGRMELCDRKIAGSKQPFHEAEPMEYPAAEKFINRCMSSSEELAGRALAAIADAHGTIGRCCVLTGSGRKLQELREILNSHTLIHTAEGVFYREVVIAAAERRGTPVERVREADLAGASDVLPGTDSGRRARLDRFGKKVGSPWRQDEKMAALGAWMALAVRPSRARTGTRLE